jgi:DNA-binding response OmpR family regulator
MANVLVVHESETTRGELTRALLGEGFTVSEADSAAAAVREVWAGNFDAAVVSGQVPGVGGVSLEEHIRSLAPEIVTLPIAKEPAAKLAKRLAELLDGGAVAA